MHFFEIDLLDWSPLLPWVGRQTLSRVHECLMT